MILPTNGVLHCALLALVALSILGFRLDAKDFWGDEISSLSFASGETVTIIGTLATRDIHPPLFFILLGSWTSVFGSTEVAAVRLLPALISILGILATYFLARELWGPQFGFLASLLLATSPLLVLRGLMVRPYSLVLCLAMLSLAFQVRLLREPRPREFVGYTLATTLMLYTDYLSATLLLAQNVLVLIYRSKDPRFWPRWVAAQVAVFLLFGPQMLALVKQATTLRGWIAPAYLSGSILGPPVKIAFTLYSFVLGETVYPWTFHISIVGLSVAGFLYAYGLRHAVDHPAQLWRPLLLGWTPIIALTALTSTVFRGGSFAMFPGHLLFVLPLFILPITRGLLALRNPIVKGVLLLVLFTVHGYALKNYYAGEQFLNPNYVIPWRRIAADLRSAVTPGDVVIATSDGLQWNRGTLATLHFGELETAATVWEAILQRKPERIWLQIREGGDPTGYVLRPEFRRRLSDLYVLVGQRGYVPQPPEAVGWRRRLLGQQITDFNVVVYQYLRRNSPLRPAGGAIPSTG